jgi:hypothetical protein
MPQRGLDLDSFNTHRGSARVTLGATGLIPKTRTKLQISKHQKLQLLKNILE